MACALWGVVAAGWMLLGSGAEGRGQYAVGEASAIDLRSIAVLPLANRSALEEDAFFVDGIHDDILTHLSQIGSLTVISRTSVMQYAGTTKPVREIAGELGVGTVLEGAVQRAGERVRVNVQLIDASTDRHLWAQSYDEELTTENIFAIQSDIARKIAAALQATLAPDVEERIESRVNMSLTARNSRFVMESGSSSTARRVSRTDSSYRARSSRSWLYCRCASAEPGFSSSARWNSRSASSKRSSAVRTVPRAAWASASVWSSSSALSTAARACGSASSAARKPLPHRKMYAPARPT